jgi:hypothetical protein
MGKIPDRPTYTISLRSDGDRDIHGLRWLLKRAWRDHQLKCVLLAHGVSPLPGETDTGLGLIGRGSGGK